MTIVLIDADRDFRDALAANLRDDGHQVREFGSPAELPPLDALDGTGALISDNQLETVDGLSLADRFHGVHPGVPIVLVTPFWSHRTDVEVAKRQYLYLRRKPLDYEELQAVLGAASAGVPRTPPTP